MVKKIKSGAGQGGDDAGLKNHVGEPAASYPAEEGHPAEGCEGPWDVARRNRQEAGEHHGQTHMLQSVEGADITDEGEEKPEGKQQWGGVGLALGSLSLFVEEWEDPDEEGEPAEAIMGAFLPCGKEVSRLPDAVGQKGGLGYVGTANKMNG